MSKSLDFRLAVLTVLVLLAVLLSSSAFAANHQLKRQVAPKQVYTALPEHSDCNTIVLKLREGTKRPALSENRFLASGGYWDRLNEILSEANGTAALRPRLSLATTQLDKMRADGSKRVGWQLPDMTLYYEVQLADDLSAQDRVDMINGLNSLDMVELAYFAPQMDLPGGPPDGKGPPHSDEDTPSYEWGQYYLRPAPVGFDAYYAWSFPGGHGENAKVIDIESNWNETHEDLHGGTDQFLIAGDIIEPDPYHGTAVLGVIAADSNDFGMTGIAYEVELGTIAIPYVLSPGDIATAIDNTNPGDIILLEVQILIMLEGDDYTYVCVELAQDIFDMILTASALGRIVIEPAANGGENYDDTELYDSLLYPEYRFSGAIMTAMAYADHSPDPRSGYGLRLDVHGFGAHDVFTLGGGNLWGTEQDNYYTQGFSGTSSASAEIAGVCAVVSSIYQEETGSTLDHAGMRNLLTTYSVSQADHERRIGPMPDLAGICDDITGFIRPASPALVSPDNEAYFDPPASLTFDWDDVTGATTYDIEIDDNFSFRSPVAQEEGLTASEWTPQALQQGKYFWRVRSVNSNGFGAWSEVRTILVDVDIQAPALLSPEDDGSTNTCINTPFEWYPVDGVVDYIVEVSSTEDFVNPMRSTYSFPCEDNTCGYSVSRLIPGDYYFWRVRVLADGSPWSEEWYFKATGPWAPRIVAPEEAASESVSVTLGANYPNPFNPVTQISFSLPEPTHARLDIFNILGQRVETLVDGYLFAGDHSAVWNAGTRSSGVYLYRLTTSDASVSRKMLLIK